MKQRAPVLSNSPTFQQLWEALGSKLIETAQGHLLYTQGVRGSSPLPPTMFDRFRTTRPRCDKKACNS